MPCDTTFRRGQTIKQRAAEAKAVASKVDSLIQAGRVRVKVGPQGAIAFEGISALDRDDLTDVCIYRRLMMSGSSMTRMAIARAEQLAGRTVSKQTIAMGTHSHDGGLTWHDGH